MLLGERRRALDGGQHARVVHGREPHLFPVHAGVGGRGRIGRKTALGGRVLPAEQTRGGSEAGVDGWFEELGRVEDWSREDVEDKRATGMVSEGKERVGL